MREYSIGTLGLSTVSLSTVHVAEREHSRMAAGSHFVSDEKERRAVATIFATLGIASRHVITDSFFARFPDRPNGPTVPIVRGPSAKSRNPRRLFGQFLTSHADQVAKVCCILCRSKRAWKITDTIEFPNAKLPADNFRGKLIPR